MLTLLHWYRLKWAIAPRNAVNQGQCQQHLMSMKILQWINIQPFLGLYGFFSYLLILLSLVLLRLPPSPFPLSVSLFVARGQFVIESTSFSHLVTVIQWCECINKRIRQGWHLAVLSPPPLALSPSHRHTVSLSHTHTLSPSLPLFLSHSLSHTCIVGVCVPLLRWVTQPPALGIPAQLIILHPWDADHCELGHQTRRPH